MIVNPMIYSGKKLPELDNPGTAADLLAGKQLVDQYGNPLTGTMPQRSAGDLSASGAAVTVPAGYYPSQVTKKVAEAAQATPGISVSSNGLITASATQGEGYVAAGTKSATRQLTTQAGKTVTPGTSRQTAVASGRYTTGAVYVAGDANLVAGNIKSGASIFGVTGNAQTLELVDVTIINNGSGPSYYVTVYPPQQANSEQVSAGQQKTIKVAKNLNLILHAMVSMNLVITCGVAREMSTDFKKKIMLVAVTSAGTVTVNFQ